MTAPATEYRPGSVTWNRAARLAYGREGEAKVRAFFEEWLGAAVKWEVADTEEDYRGIDAKVKLHFSVQIKRDAAANKWGTVFLELWRRRAGGPQVDSWARAPVAYLHCHLIPAPLGRIYLLRADALRTAVARWERDRSLHTHIASDGGVARCGLSVPMARFSEQFPPLRQGADV